MGMSRGEFSARLAAMRGDGPSLLLRGLDFAIVDEADSVLVDAARTPLILSGEQDSQIDEEIADRALAFARRLVAGRDWAPIPHRLSALLTEEGEIRLAAWLEADPAPEAGSVWSIPRVREELVRHALAALHLFQRGEHYLVRDGKILIVDEFTGRAMPDRQWADGLHQMVERKEGCAPTRRRVTLGAIDVPALFPALPAPLGHDRNGGGSGERAFGPSTAFRCTASQPIVPCAARPRATASRKLRGEMERRGGGGRRADPRESAGADRNPHRRGLIAR